MVLAVPFAVLGASALISYERAKAESLGYEAKGGLMERAERIIAICVGLAFSDLLVPILWLMLGLTAVTAVQRFVKVWKQAAVAPIVASRPVPRPAWRPPSQTSPATEIGRQSGWGIISKTRPSVSRRSSNQGTSFRSAFSRKRVFGVKGTF